MFLAARLSVDVDPTRGRSTVDTGGGVVVRTIGGVDGAEASNADAVAKQWKDSEATLRVMQGSLDALEPLQRWDASAMEPVMQELAASLGYGDKLGKLFQPLRVALTGRAVSPGIFDVLVLLGRERSLQRLKAAISRLRSL